MPRHRHPEPSWSTITRSTQTKRSPKQVTPTYDTLRWGFDCGSLRPGGGRRLRRVLLRTSEHLERLIAEQLAELKRLDSQIAELRRKRYRAHPRLYTMIMASQLRALSRVLFGGVRTMESAADRNHFRRPRWLLAIPSTKVTMLLRMFWFSMSVKARTNRTEAAVSRKLKPSLILLVAASLPEAP
jgi:hypothetical protein